MSHSVAPAPKTVEQAGHREGARPPPCAVTRLSMPAAVAAAVNRSPIICANNNGTNRSPGRGS